MKLSPDNLRFMEQAVGLIITQGLFIPVGPADANTLLLIALYMGQDYDAHNEMRERLKSRGDKVLRIWDDYFKLVMKSNEDGTNNISESVSQFITRISNESQNKR